MCWRILTAQVLNSILCFWGVKSYIASRFLAFIYKLAILFLATWITQLRPSCTCISKDFLLVGRCAAYSSITSGMISHAIAGRRLTKRLVSAYSAPFLGPDSGFSTGPVSSLTPHVRTKTLYAIYDILEYYGHLEIVCPRLINDILQEIKDGNSGSMSFSVSICHRCKVASPQLEHKTCVLQKVVIRQHKVSPRLFFQSCETHTSPSSPSLRTSVLTTSPDILNIFLVAWEL